MSKFAEWRPCRVCGLPVALPKRVHDECAEQVETEDENQVECVESPDAPQEAPQEHERQPGYGWAGIFM